MFGSNTNTVFVLIWLAILVLAVIFSWLFGFIIGWLFGQKQQKQVIYLNAIDSSWGVNHQKKLSKPKQFASDINRNVFVEEDESSNSVNNQEKISIWQNPIFSRFALFNKHKRKNNNIKNDNNNIDYEPEHIEARTIGSKILRIAIIVLVILLSGYYAFNYAITYSYNQQADQEDKSIANGEQKTDPNADKRDATLLFTDVDISSWLTRVITNPNLSVKYPKNWTINNYQSDWQFTPDAINKESAIIITADSKDYPKETDLKKWDIDINEPDVKKQYDEYKLVALATDISLKIWVVDSEGKPVGAYSRNKIAGTEKSRVPLVLNNLTVNKYINVIDKDKIQYTTYFFEIPDQKVMLVAQIKSPIGVNEENRLFYIFNKIVRNIKPIE